MAPHLVDGQASQNLRQACRHLDMSQQALALLLDTRVWQFPPRSEFHVGGSLLETLEIPDGGETVHNPGEMLKTQGE